LKSKQSAAKQFGIATEQVKLFGYDVPVKAPTPREFIVFEELAKDQVGTPTEQNIRFAATLINSRCGQNLSVDDLMNADYTDEDELAIGTLMASFFQRLRIRAKTQLEQVKAAQDLVSELRQTGQVSTLS
jgi:hypothetical protein